MIIVNLRRTYPDVLAGTRHLQTVTLGAWAAISDSALQEFGDVVVGVFGDEVVSAYDVKGHVRDADARVTFVGQESTEFRNLIGRPSPIGQWERGQARPVKYIATHVVRDGDVEEELLPNVGRRAVVGGYILTVDTVGFATIEPPQNGRVTVISSPSQPRA